MFYIHIHVLADVINTHHIHRASIHMSQNRLKTALIMTFLLHIQAVSVLSNADLGCITADTKGKKSQQWLWIFCLLVFVDTVFKVHLSDIVYESYDIDLGNWRRICCDPKELPQNLQTGMQSTTDPKMVWYKWQAYK